MLSVRRRWDEPVSDDRPCAYLEGDTSIYRCSSVGHACITALVAARTGLTPIPPPSWLQDRFDEGTDAEPIVLERLAMYDGWTLNAEGAQEEHHLEVMSKVLIRMHLDGRGVPAGTDREHVVEVKAFGKDYWEQFCSRGLKSFEGYAWQTSIQMYATGLPLAFVVVRKPDKSEDGTVDRAGFWDAEIKVEFVDEPIVPLGVIKKKVIKAEMLARKGELPMCVGDRFPCDFPFLHEAKEREVDELGEVEALINAAADHLAQCRESKKHWEDKEKVARERLLEVLGGREKVVTKRFDVQVVKQTRTSVDGKLLEAEFPEVAEKVKRETVVESLRVKAAP